MIRWEPVGELNTIQSEMNRLFNTLLDSPSRASNSGSSSRRWIPPMDLVETGDEYVLRADLPGLADGDVTIELEDNVLTVSGERKEQHEDRNAGYHRIERGWGSFSRSLTLPEGVNSSAVQAHIDRGVLEIRIPKPEQRKPRRVEISVTESGPRQPDTIQGAEAAASNGDAGVPATSGR